MSDWTPSTLSLFSGAGGLDFGFEAAGFEVRAALEFDADSCATYRKHSEAEVIEADALHVPTDRLLAACGAGVGGIDTLIGGPPCQPFSKAGYWATGDAKRLDDPRAATLGAYLRILEEAQPRVMLLENVEGMDYRKKDEGFRSFEREVDAINGRTGSAYRLHCKVLNAADYGVPQFRRRFIVVAARDGAGFEFPEPTHGGPDAADLYTRVEPHRTAWDALGDLPAEPEEDLALRGKWADLLPSIPEGENYLWHTDRGGGVELFGWRRRFWSFLLKLAKDKPSWTIPAQPGPATGPFHWRSRRLSMRELCRLQTFPDRVNIVGGRGSVQKQVGNAVPSLLGEVLAREIRRQLLGHTPPAEGLKLLPPRRGAAPPPEPVGPVPERLLGDIGTQSAHPGTGLGYGALARAGA